MKNSSSIFKLISNKYLLALAGFTIWILFFDRNDLFTQWDRKQELNRLEVSSAYYQSQITGLKKEIADLNNNPAIVEKFAREKFYLKRANEDVFLVVDSTLSKN